MKKLNQKGFTLIELLAVVTIMGILMIVAIPAISRTIENSRKDTFVDTAKQYVNATKTLWAADSIECTTLVNNSGNWVAGDAYTVASALPAGTYFLAIDSSDNDLLESGGTSSWGSKQVKGFVKIIVDAASDSESGKVTYAVALTDGVHGMKESVNVDGLKRSSVLVTGADYPAVPTNYDTLTCQVNQ